MPEAIPPSPYPVLGMYGGGPPPRKTLDGPYIASRPAYQMFAGMAETGQSIHDVIDADHAGSANRTPFDPVKAYASSGYWFHDGEMEMLPNWPNPNNQAKPTQAAAAEPAPGPALPPVSAPLAGPAVLPAPQVVPSLRAAPAAPAPAREAPLAAPAEPSGAAAAARAPQADEPRTVQLASSSGSKGKASRLAQQLARLSYGKDVPVSHRTRAAQRPQTAGARRAGTATL
jgi:hypothetical protein